MNLDPKLYPKLLLKYYAKTPSHELKSGFRELIYIPLISSLDSKLLKIIIKFIIKIRHPNSGLKIEDIINLANLEDILEFYKKFNINIQVLMDKLSQFNLTPENFEKIFQEIDFEKNYGIFIHKFRIPDNILLKLLTNIQDKGHIFLIINCLIRHNYNISDEILMELINLIPTNFLINFYQLDILISNKPIRFVNNLFDKYIINPEFDSAWLMNILTNIKFRSDNPQDITKFIINILNKIKSELPIILYLPDNYFDNIINNLNFDQKKLDYFLQYLNGQSADNIIDRFIKLVDLYINPELKPYYKFRIILRIFYKIDLISKLINQFENLKQIPKKDLEQFLEKAFDINLSESLLNLYADKLIASGFKNFISIPPFRLNFPIELEKKLIYLAADPRTRIYPSPKIGLVNIDPNKPFESLCPFLGVDQQLRINYIGQIASDCGGVISDLYYLINKEIQKYFINFQNFSYFNLEYKSDKILWNNLGKLFGRAFALDYRPVGIKIHPYIICRIINYPDKNINLDNQIFDNLDFIINLRKLNNISDADWESFKKLENTELNRSDYINSIINKNFELEYSEIIPEFLSGFLLRGNSQYLKYLPSEFLFQKLYGNHIVNIPELNLRIGIHKDPFIQVISEIQDKNPENFIKLLRFWIGNPYLSLTNKSLYVTFDNRSYKICRASTCGFELIFPSIPTNIQHNPQEIKEFLMNCITNSILNQEMADFFNFQMQTN